MFKIILYVRYLVKCEIISGLICLNMYKIVDKFGFWENFDFRWLYLFVIFVRIKWEMKLFF